MYKEELGGGAWLLYNLNGKDWLLDERTRWLVVQNVFGRESFVALWF